MSVNTLAPPLTEAEKALVTKEVLLVVKPMFAAAERMDPEFVPSFCLDTLDFRITWFNGTTTGYAESNKNWREFASKYSSQRLEIHTERIHVLAADMVLHYWQGWTELIQKDGGAVRLDPFAETTLLQKVGSYWKIASRADSGVPTRLPNPASSPWPN